MLVRATFLPVGGFAANADAQAVVSPSGGSGRVGVSTMPDIPRIRMEEVERGTQHFDNARDDEAADALSPGEADYSPPASPVPIAEVVVDPAAISSSGGSGGVVFDIS